MDNILENIIRRRNLDGQINHNLIRGVVLHDIFDPAVVALPRPVFNLVEMDEKEVELNFRFQKEDIPRLARALTRSGHLASGLEGICILLRRLAYPNRLSAALSEIVIYMNNHIYDNFRHLLEDLNSLNWLNPNRLQIYSESITAKGTAVQNCCAFIDDGLTISEIGAYPGRRHDAGIFRESGIYNQLEQKLRLPNGATFVLYGDQAYGIRCMSVVRQAVEWSFQKVISLFAFLDLKKKQKLLLQDIQEMFKTATILTNCYTCLYGNQTSQFFNVNPVNLEEYLDFEA